MPLAISRLAPTLAVTKPVVEAILAPEPFMVALDQVSPLCDTRIVVRVSAPPMRMDRGRIVSPTLLMEQLAEPGVL